MMSLLNEEKMTIQNLERKSVVTRVEKEETFRPFVFNFWHQIVVGFCFDSQSTLWGLFIFSVVF